MMKLLAFLIIIVGGLAACSESPQPTMHLHPVVQVNLDMLPARIVSQALTPEPSP